MSVMQHAYTHALHYMQGRADFTIAHQHKLLLVSVQRKMSAAHRRITSRRGTSVLEPTGTVQAHKVALVSHTFGVKEVIHHTQQLRLY